MSRIFKTAFDVPAEIRNTDKAPLRLLSSFGRFEQYKAGPYTVGVKYTHHNKSLTGNDKNIDLVKDIKAKTPVLIFSDPSTPSVPSAIAIMAAVPANSVQQKILQMTYGTIDTPETSFTNMIPLSDINSHLVIRDGMLCGILVDTVGYYSLNGGKGVKAPGKEEKEIPYYDTEKVRGVAADAADVDDEFLFDDGKGKARTSFAGKQYGAARRGVAKRKAVKRVARRRYC